MKKLIYVPIIAVVFLLSCSKDDDLDPIIEPDPEPIVDVWEVNRFNQRALDVVFFKPKDFQANETLMNGVSETMLFIQGWYEKQMELQGFGKKTFGLVTNQKGNVRIHLIQGKEVSSFYDGHNEIVDEINAYFGSNSGLRQGNHLFVLGSSGSGVPFYGIGKTAFATSDDFILRSTGQFIDDLELKVCNKLGGVMHELAHCLNLPHNAHKASELPNISLMSYGNHTYQDAGKSNLVFLTKSDCAILDVNEVFNTRDKQYYTNNPTIVMESYSVTKHIEKKATIVEGLLTSDIVPTHFYVGHDGYPLDGGYDNITFTTKLMPTENENEYSFYVEMPYSDIFNGYQEKERIELSMVVVSENGFIKVPVKYEYTTNPVSLEPNDDILKEYVPYIFSDRSQWNITVNTMANVNQSASKMIDGNLESYWHSKWPYLFASNGAHEIEINMNKVDVVSGLYLISSRPGGQFRPKHLIVQTSENGNNWETIQEATISSIGKAAEIIINFEQPISTQFIKIQVDQVYMSNGTEENLLLNELDVILQ